MLGRGQEAYIVSNSYIPISCIGSKFTQMRAHTGASFTWSLRSTASSAVHIWGKKLRVILHRRLLQGRTKIMRYMYALWATPCSLWHGTVQSVVCHQDSTSKLLVVLLYITACQLFASSRYKHDMGALSWLNGETFERVPATPLFGRLVSCSSHGCSFARAC